MRKLEESKLNLGSFSIVAFYGDFDTFGAVLFDLKTSKKFVGV